MSWPVIVGGKPFNSWPAFVPVMFEGTILFAGLFTVGAMFLANRLPNITKKAFDPSLTRDRFALLIEAPTPSQAVSYKKRGYREFSESDAKDMLKKVGAKSNPSTPKGGLDENRNDPSSSGCNPCSHELHP